MCLGNACVSRQLWQRNIDARDPDRSIVVVEGAALSGYKVGTKQSGIGLTRYDWGLLDYIVLRSTASWGVELCQVLKCNTT
jgi:hypothetical protein